MTVATPSESRARPIAALDHKGHSPTRISDSLRASCQRTMIPRHSWSCLVRTVSFGWILRREKGGVAATRGRESGPESPGTGQSGPGGRVAAASLT